VAHPAAGVRIDELPLAPKAGRHCCKGKMLEVNKKGITPQRNAGTFYPGANDQTSLLQVDFIDEVRPMTRPVSF
jgi:hypothetical protein